MDFLGRGFKAAKCKTLLRLAMSRIKLLRNKRENQVKGIRKEIANLLQTGQEPSARIRIEHVFREQNVMAAYEIIELFCELVVVRLPIIESQKQCPLDLKEAIASLIFAAPRCADLPELQEVRALFAIKYGKEFVAAAGELRPDCGVNRRIIEKLSVRAPSGEVKLKLLKEIAAEYNVEWDPTDTEAELLKQHEDLLDGPSQFMSSSERPFSGSANSNQHRPEPSADDLPSVPSQSLRPNISPDARASDEQASAQPPSTQKQPSKTFVRPASPPPVTQDDDVDSERQFIPFVITPPVEAPQATPTLSKNTSFQDEDRDRWDMRMEYKDVAVAAQAAAESAERAAAAARAAAKLAKDSFKAPVTTNEDKSQDEARIPANSTGSSFNSRWERTQDDDLSSDSDEDDDAYHATSKSTKPVGKPDFDNEEDDDDDDDYNQGNGIWRKQPSGDYEVPSISKQPSAKYDIFDINAEQGRFAPRQDLFSDVQPPAATQHDYFRRSQRDIPSYDSSPSASMPQFDEPQQEDIPKARKLSWQSSIPPQRPPPDVPKPSRSDSTDSSSSPKPAVSRTDSGSSSTGGHSVHPKLPDYDDLAARFQALKSKR